VIDRDRAAMTLYLDARETEKKAKRPEVARSQYLQVIKLFPDSPAARLARQRLKPERAVPMDKDHTYPGSM